MTSIQAIILAAGKGTRMKSALPKPLHSVFGKPMIEHLLQTVRAVGIRRPVVVIGRSGSAMRAVLSDVSIVTQRQARGSADAVSAGLRAVRGRPRTIMVFYADTPFIKKGTLQRLITQHAHRGADITFLTAMIADPFGYGRIVRGAGGRATKIVEEAEATDGERQIREVNVGVYCFAAGLLREALRTVTPSRKKKEFYLTDAVNRLLADGRTVDTVMTSSLVEALGVNSRSDLAEIIRLRKAEVVDELMANGVTVIDPATTFIAPDVRIGPDTVVYPNTVIEGPARIGRRCRIGPFARVRGGVELGDDVEIGNFVELVRSTVGARTKIKHLSYLGDATVGKDVNIGAGFITANFDGTKKNRTVIRDRSSLGVGSVVIAPATVGKAATVGAGCVITKHFRVPDRSTVVGIPARVLTKRRGG